jgi:hypothetical protein
LKLKNIDFSKFLGIKQPVLRLFSPKNQVNKHNIEHQRNGQTNDYRRSFVVTAEAIKIK